MHSISEQPLRLGTLGINIHRYWWQVWTRSWDLCSSLDPGQGQMIHVVVHLAFRQCCKVWTNINEIWVRFCLIGDAVAALICITVRHEYVSDIVVLTKDFLLEMLWGIPFSDDLTSRDAFTGIFLSLWDVLLRHWCLWARMQSIKMTCLEHDIMFFLTHEKTPVWKSDKQLVSNSPWNNERRWRRAWRRPEACLCVSFSYMMYNWLLRKSYAYMNRPQVLTLVI